MLSNVVLFEGTDSSGHTELWETDGTAAGTFELTGIVGAASTGLYPSDLTNYNGEVLFTSADARGDFGLWVTDGTAAGTHELAVAGALAKSQYPFLAGLNPSGLTVYDGYAFFAGVDASGLVELWETDGTAAGTHELAVAGASPGPYLAGIPPGLSPSGFTVYNGGLYFAGADASGLFGLWDTDGTAAGTHELTDVAAATTGLAPSDLTVLNDQILFGGKDAHGQTGLWVTNGTAAGTHELSGIVGAQTTGIGLDPSDLTVYNGEALFRGIDSSGLYGLWETDGTAGGTHELTGVAGASTTAGVGFLPSNLTDYNGGVLFTARDSSGLYGLWVTNGTAAGTHEFTGIAGAQTSGVGLDPTDFTVYDGEVLFSGYDSSGKLGLWVTNGTAAGTHELTGVAAAGATGLAPTDLTAVGGPVLTAAASIKYVAGGAPVTLDAGLSISDTESTSLIGATVSIGAGFLTGDALSVGSPQTGVASSYNAATGVLTLSGAASLSAYQTELDSVTFASPTETNPSRTIAWSVNDGVATSTPASSSVSLAADPPVVDPCDILWRSIGGQAAMWEMNGVNVVGGGVVSADPGPTWYAIGTGDFNADGLSDILWQNANGQAAIWEMNGTNIIGGGTVGPNPGPSWKEIGTGDFNHDGHSDILWQNTSGQAAIWEMNGTNIIGSGTVGPNPGPSWKEIGSGDFNDDGHSDILWQNTSGQVAIWEMNGTSIVGGAVISANPGPSWKAIETGNFNGDGHSDILFQNASSGQVAIWEMNGTSIIGGGAVSANAGPSWHAIGTGGGGADILFQSTSGQTAIWDMSGTNIVGGGIVSANAGASWKAIKLT